MHKRQGATPERPNLLREEIMRRREFLKYATATVVGAPFVRVARADSAL